MKLISNRWFLLGIGGLFVCFTGMKWNVPIFSWFLFIPFFRYLRLGYSIPILLFSFIGFQILSTMRIVSEPFHIWIAILSGIQAGFVFTLLLWLWNTIRIRFTNLVSPILFFAFFCIILEWIGGYNSDLGVWGMIANSQIGNLILLQSASLYGALGISFVIYLINVSLEQCISELIDTNRIQKDSALYLLTSFVLLVLLYFYGTIRLHLPITGEQIKIATITTKYDVTSMFHHPEINAENTKLTFEKTILAAKEGAKVVVWNEGAVLVTKEKESELLRLVSVVAKENKIEVIAALIVQLKDQEFFFDNQLVWFASDGTIRQTYYKQFLVPGEPVSKHHSDIKAFQVLEGKMSVAICYDFDSLRVTEHHAKEGSGLVLIPASDWKGITPFHTEMAVLRGIENGSSIVRSVRDGLSGIYDAYGRARGTLDSFENNDGVLVSSVPMIKLDTIYSRYGNWLVGIGFLYLGIASIRILFFVIKNRIKAK
ncbi:acyltransferase [Leptospira kemamanensis]|uniref:Acyltransferase n=1 Tax=Leptospira kemamanensis TaxID=2484942 RepID=A0A4R9JPT7_9LEPT|nr:nitrilase-related carbon-nitrogen hydrolase [Leptospira kemamanensis]TGL53141.1 acyltransferase [Leptospira kemamanensis]